MASFLCYSTPTRFYNFLQTRTIYELDIDTVMIWVGMNFAQRTCTVRYVHCTVYSVRSSFIDQYHHSINPHSQIAHQITLTNKGVKLPRALILPRYGTF